MAITILVKNPQSIGHCKIFFGSVDNYLNREQKLQQLKSLGSIVHAPVVEIEPDEHSDWLNQRRSDFAHFLSIDGKNQADGVFSVFSTGIQSSRDAWTYNASQQALAANMRKCIAFYNAQVARLQQAHNHQLQANQANQAEPSVLPQNSHAAQQSQPEPPTKHYAQDPTQIKWTRSLLNDLNRQRYYQPFTAELITPALFRPFFKEWLYNDAKWINSQGLMPKLFPWAGADNLTINITGTGAQNFSCLMSNHITCLDCLDKAQCFPRFVYLPAHGSGLTLNQQDYDAHGLNEVLAKPSSARSPSLLDLLDEQLKSGDDVVNVGDGGSSKLMSSTSQAAIKSQQTPTNLKGFVKVDALKPAAIEHFRQAYPQHGQEIDADMLFFFIYGLLHSPEYRETYASNLQKELPRIPRLRTFTDFKLFARAGRALSKLHVGYEHVEPYAGCVIDIKPHADFRVTKMRYGKLAGSSGYGSKAKDKTVIHYNEHITIRHIPLEVQEYMVKKKSALDWLVERCGVSKDKDSQIANDYNDYAQAQGDAKYIFNLVLRIITVSLETMKIVKSLPPLDIHPLDQRKN